MPPASAVNRSRPGGEFTHTDRLPPNDQCHRCDDNRREGQEGKRRGETGCGQHHREEQEQNDTANPQDSFNPAHRSDTVVECEPDYRFTLANERTFLAWQRTALGLLAAAVAVVQLVPDLTIPGARHVLGVLLAVLASLTVGIGLLRWKQVDRAIRRGNPLPHPRLPCRRFHRARLAHSWVGDHQGGHRLTHAMAEGDQQGNGLQAERTVLAWTRTSFAFLANSFC